MPEFPKPTFPYSYQVDAQIQALRGLRAEPEGTGHPRQVTGSTPGRPWNIANLGVQERRDKDYRLIAEMISWFDLVAVQEVNDNLAGLRAIQTYLPAPWKAVFSDKAGNDERAAFVYHSAKIELLEQIGEGAIPPSYPLYPPQRQPGGAHRV